VLSRFFANIISKYQLTLRQQSITGNIV